MIKQFSKLQDGEHIEDLPELKFLEKLNEIAGHKVGRIRIQVHPVLSKVIENEV